ncbi:MAG TPA: EscU/YscU/HrcU family type III secretion system export apparatus switch protein [Burkholderiaceae bacterium]|nr:EscU/YscU/HrcU family type III secretion system export apparatus switch protein [Burkholderiaceae bacterium]
MDSSQEKDLPATGRRLAQARGDGQVARSKDLSNLVVLGGGFWILVSYFPEALSRLKDGLQNQLRFDHNSLARADFISAHVVGALISSAYVFLPLAVALLCASVLTTFVNGGWAPSTKPLELDLNKLNPLTGLGNLFSKEKLTDVLKLLALCTVIGTIGWFYLAAHLKDFASLTLHPLDAGLIRMGLWLKDGIWILLFVVLVEAMIDVPLSKYQFAQRMRMSHEEVKQEHKEVEGNPQMKGRIKARQREAANRRSIAAVPKADLVVMNPTHYAVALRYDESTMAVPKVIAKGTDLVALQIRDVAKGHKVPVMQSPMLARALYAHTELDGDIPQALYTAVAQVLAYVYQVRAAMQGKGRMPLVEPVPDVPVELDPHHGRELAPETQGNKP